MNGDRTLPWDWFSGQVPENVLVHPEAYLETTFSFHLFRSKVPEAVRIGRGASVYLGVMFDLGLEAQVNIGEFTLLNGARIICDSRISIGDYCLVSWNVVFMDTYRVPFEARLRRRVLRETASAGNRVLADGVPGKPITIDPNVWIGFDSCILPGVTIGRGAIIGARSVVTQDVPPYTVAAGNPARVIRTLSAREMEGCDFDPAILSGTASAERTNFS